MTIHYDGGSIGEHGKDKLQNIIGLMGLASRGTAGWYSTIENNSALYPGANSVLSSLEGWAVGSGWPYATFNRMHFDASRSARTGHETTPVWIAYYVCMQY